jgi:hypothetical protein
MTRNSARTANAKKPTARKASTKRKSGNASSAPPEVSPEQRWRMIAEAAYLRAEKRGFVEGHAVDDWLEAEQEIKRLLAEM